MKFYSLFNPESESKLPIIRVSTTVIGSPPNGDNLKSIGINCRKELKSMLNKDVHLFLYVKVRDNWDKSQDYYKGLGLDYNV